MKHDLLDWGRFQKDQKCIWSRPGSDFKKKKKNRIRAIQTVIKKNPMSLNEAAVWTELLTCQSLSDKQWWCLHSADQNQVTDRMGVLVSSTSQTKDLHLLLYMQPAQRGSNRWRGYGLKQEMTSSASATQSAVMIKNSLKKMKQKKKQEQTDSDPNVQEKPNKYKSGGKKLWWKGDWSDMKSKQPYKYVLSEGQIIYCLKKKNRGGKKR